MIRRTKVVATLGPASSDAKTLARMIEAGLDVVRINFSHGSPDEHRARVNLVRQLARKAGRAVGVLVDLQGPKIRVGKFRDGKVTLAPGDDFILDAEMALGDASGVGLDYKELPRDVKKGDTLLLDEPLEGLAPIVVEELLRAIRRITREEGMSAIIVEQHPQAILAISHHAVVLDQGRVIHSGNAADLLQQTDLLDRLLGVKQHV